MMHRVLSRACGVALLAFLAGGCATAALRIEPGPSPAAGRLSDVHLEPGTRTVVQLVGGETLQGTTRRLTADRLALVIPSADGSHERTIAESEIQMLARVVGRSKGSRGRIGAVIGAAVTAPFGISMIGDMVVVGAIAGALIGRATGDARAEIVFERGRGI